MELELVLTKPATVLACCAAAVVGASMPCTAQTFGAFYSNYIDRSLSPGRADPELAKWLMVLPQDDDPGMLDASPIGGEVYKLTKPTTHERTVSIGKPERGIAVWYRLPGRTSER